MPKGGFWYVYAVWSGRPLTHTYSFKPHAHLMAILLPQKKVKTKRTLANCPKHLTKTQNWAMWLQSPDNISYHLQGTISEHVIWFYSHRPGTPLKFSDFLKVEKLAITPMKSWILDFIMLLAGMNSSLRVLSSPSLALIVGQRGRCFLGTANDARAPRLFSLPVLST